MSRHWLILSLFLGLALGQPFYKGYCSSCHMPDARGIPGLYPPLTFIAAYLCLPEGRAYLIKAVLWGLIGPLKLEGVDYRGTRFMPAFGDLLDDEGVALVLNDLMRVIAVKGVVFTPREVSHQRTPRLTPNQVYRLREGLLTRYPQPPCPRHD